MLYQRKRANSPINAIQCRGNNFNEIYDLLKNESGWSYVKEPGNEYFELHRRKCNTRILVGCWIIKFSNNYLYVTTNETFQNFYEPLNESTSS